MVLVISDGGSMTTITRSTEMSTKQTQYFKHAEGTLAYTDYGGSGELVLTARPEPLRRARNPWGLTEVLSLSVRMKPLASLRRRGEAAWGKNCFRTWKWSER